MEHFSKVTLSCIVHGDTGTQCAELRFLSGDWLLLLLLYSVHLGIERDLDLRYFGERDRCLENDLFLVIDLLFLGDVFENDLLSSIDFVLRFEFDLEWDLICDLLTNPTGDRVCDLSWDFI